MNICVFCSSSNGIDDCYFDAANQLGKLIGERGHNLINGGSNVGLMEASALATKAANGKAYGIIPEAIHERGLGSKTSDELLVTPNMRERKYLLRKKSDAFIALPGGFGTLEEILEVITLKQLQYHSKAIVFINTNGFYNPLIEQFERSYHESFAKEVYRKLYFVTDSEEEAMEYIENYQPEDVDTKWHKVPEKK
ncbi:TIGR00730 family Rossman fold protein [Prolixibacteraceae bacterium JC049]|nr:TIGR00730 family Rossman fold protein [Prolixibacteraceae bacterium JC049]